MIISSLWVNHLLPFAVTYTNPLPSESEIRLLWRRPRNAGGYLFFVNRYLAFGNIVTAIALFSTTFTPSLSIFGDILSGVPFGDRRHSYWQPSLLSGSMRYMAVEGLSLLSSWVLQSLVPQ
ncbi:hypothetical protein BDP27DRAFT_992085 [Rhodocollybia butyracea]|uniref:DUF6533 domain-containing protein n=1 Tax=Rhodocollybia butyracea TaxID=206335 RepID=A0A9P5U5G8_9AGAR|nr:hypothetical protein BDP27DRAFT_992085 [Rhodocollybia butyracea]